MDIKSVLINFLYSNVTSLIYKYMFPLIFDKKLTGSLRMFRLRLTPKYHICFMSNRAYMNGPKGYSITVMRKYREEGAYTSVLKILDNQ